MHDRHAYMQGCGAAQVSRSGLSSARSSLRDGVNVIVAHAAHATVSTCIGDGSHSGGVSSRATNMHQSSGTGSTPETQKPPITSLNSPSGVNHLCSWIARMILLFEGFSRNLRGFITVLSTLSHREFSMVCTRCRRRCTRCTAVHPKHNV